MTLTRSNAAKASPIRRKYMIEEIENSSIIYFIGKPYNRSAQFFPMIYICMCKCVDDASFRCDYLYVLVHLFRNMIHNLRLNLPLPRFTFETKLKPKVWLNRTYVSQNEM